MTAKNVRCADCKLCDYARGWCSIKGLQVAVNSIRNCKIYARKGA